MTPLEAAADALLGLCLQLRRACDSGFYVCPVCKAQLGFEQGHRDHCALEHAEAVLAALSEGES
jgi:hypothetical protein